jgi:penicillin-binding protein 1A
MINYFRSYLKIISIFILFGISIVFYLSRDLPSLERLETFDPAMLSTLYDRNGEIIGEFFYSEESFYRY